MCAGPAEVPVRMSKLRYTVVKYGVPHWRIRIPSDLQQVLGKTEMRKSLAGMSKRAAELEVMRLTVNARAYFDDVRKMQSRSTQGSQYPSDICHVCNSQQQRAVPVPAMSLPSVDSNVGNNSPRLSELVEAYSVENVRAGNWLPKTEAENAAIYTLLIRLIGDLHCDELSYPILRRYKTVLMKLPANMNKSPRYRGKSIDEILQLHDCKPMSISNVNKFLSRVSGLLRWSVKNGYITVNFAESLTVKRNNRPDQERSAYTDEQLKLIFSQPLFVEHKFKHPFQYWIPLLANFSGARLNELSQLHLKDVQCINDIRVISINSDSPDKKLKTAAAERIIPLHSEILRLGFIEHVERMRRLGKQRVFPELKLTRDSYGQRVSRWYCRFCQQLQLAGSGQDKLPTLHSFRHTVAMKLRQSGCSMDEVGEILGHSNGKTTARYAKRLNVNQLKAIIEMLDYPSMHSLPAMFRRCD